MNQHDISDLKQRCPMPELMHRIGLGQYAKSSCRSPFREDSKPSFGIFQGGHGLWFFKDHATGETGDELTLLAMHHGLDLVSSFPEVLELYAGFAGSAAYSPPTQAKNSKSLKRSTSATKEVGIDLGPFHTGSLPELESLSKARPYHLEGLLWASNRGVLLFGTIASNPAYLVTDKTRKVAEARRVDGGVFNQGNKSHCLKGSCKSWPLGITEAKEFQNIALVEGIPDFLHAHALILHEQSLQPDGIGATCAPVAMLGASCTISEEALHHFKGKKVTLYPHADQAGQEAAQRWGDQLYSSGIEDIDIFSLEGATDQSGNRINDLYDTFNLSAESLEDNPSLGKMFYA